ncbi:hypothetical protein CHS0354_038196, partial [Potamilus streckersoni]
SSVKKAERSNQNQRNGASDGYDSLPSNESLEGLGFSISTGWSLRAKDYLTLDKEQTNKKLVVNKHEMVEGKCRSLKSS